MRMRKFVNGQYLDMTEEEIAELKAENVEIPTAEERILALEKELAELKEALKDDYSKT